MCSFICIEQNSAFRECSGDDDGTSIGAGGRDDVEFVVVNEGTPMVGVLPGDRVMAIVGGAVIVMPVDGWVGAVVGLAVGGEDIGADVGVSVGDVGNPPKMKARLAMFELAPPLLSEQVQQTKPAQPLVHCLAMSLGFAVVEKLAGMVQMMAQRVSAWPFVTH